MMKPLVNPLAEGHWFDASDMGTLFQDKAGMVPVTAIGQPVRLVKSKTSIGALHCSDGTYAVDANGVGFIASKSGVVQIAP
jgi:hypothetical protein